MSRSVPQRRREYPDAARFRDLPAYGLYCRHVTRLSLERTSLTVAAYIRASDRAFEYMFAPGCSEARQARVLM